jgi:transposase InsO family protein
MRDSESLSHRYCETAVTAPLRVAPAARLQKRFEATQIAARFRSAYDEWLWREMGIRGIPIPYGAPNEAAHIERLIGTLRRKCLDRMLIWNEQHLRCVLTELIRRYNHGRVHQGLNGIPDPDPAIDGPKPLGGRLVAIPVLNGLHHDYRMAA